ncbi:MAG: response regulator transcription factor [Desulfuromonadaceae bacterium]|nr:response regulator transcription factor [Desulfuromonadaceae bacterium]MDD5107607.1 response regulator transcription factor [Desulfuromonadaceae bacterium]
MGLEEGVVTERKKSEQDLLVQHLTLHSIIDSTNALIFSVDRHYRYTCFNKKHSAAMKALYGAEIEQGHSLYEYMTVAEDREISRRNLDRALAGEHLVEEAYSGEEFLSRRYFQVTHNPIITGPGEVIGVAVLAQDMTELKRIELEILDRQKRLSELVCCNTFSENLELAAAKGTFAGEWAKEALVTAERRISAGKPYYCPGNILLKSKESHIGSASENIASALTKREQEVLKLTAEGYNTKELAFELGVSVKMIETHRKHIKNKLGLKNIAQLVTCAARNGLITIGGYDE